MNRGVLVTGASRGIGRAIAAMFAEAGDRVAVHYNRSAAEARTVVDSLPGTIPPAVVMLAFDAWHRRSRARPRAAPA